MKGPVTPDQAPTAPGAKKDNTGLKVVVIVLVVLFGMPLLFMIIAMIFISANFDKFAEWVDSHMDNSYSISTEQRLSLANIEQAVTNEQARQVGVSRPSTSVVPIETIVRPVQFVLMPPSWTCPRGSPLPACPCTLSDPVPEIAAST